MELLGTLPPVAPITPKDQPKAEPRIQLFGHVDPPRAKEPVDSNYPRMLYSVDGKRSAIVADFGQHTIASTQGWFDIEHLRAAGVKINLDPTPTEKMAISRVPEPERGLMLRHRL